MFETENNDASPVQVSALNSATLDSAGGASSEGPAPPASASPLQSVSDFGPFDFIGWLKQNQFYVVGSVLACR